ncbi:MAG: hypothetical protein JRG96_17160 [Deltaproteobacteria bacterium]|nr:hypothetical protein [Deltaproteobacteria bacterium]MBW2416988.1 hypothetical protein [Deltaproteobacteria bacterium]
MAGMDGQLFFVAAAAALAALYAGRAVWRQLHQPDDEPRGCRGCPVNPSSPSSPAGRPGAEPAARDPRA